VIRDGLIAVALLASAPAPSLANNLYVETGRLVDVAAGKLLPGQCISFVDEKIAATNLFR